MIEVAVQQGSQDWLDLRRGIPTASQFSRVVTPTGKLSESRHAYMAELLAEYFAGEDGAEAAEWQGNEWTRWGLQMEPRAIAAYAFQTDRHGERRGLCYRDKSCMVAASPDWMCDPDGLAEVKCPMVRTHLLYLALGVLPRDYYCQVQGQLWVTGRAWCDFVSFAPGLPLLIVRVEPDQRYQEALDEHMPAFVAALLDARRALVARGVTDPHAQAAETDRQWFDRVFVTEQKGT